MPKTAARPKPTAAGAKAAKEAKMRKADTSREIKYPDISHGPYWGADAITATTARDWLGWEEEAEGKTFGDDYLFLDVAGNKVRCTNDRNNRDFRRKHALAIAYTILNRQWAGPNGTGWKDDPDDPLRKTINGEAMVIGRTGLTISCQHRLVGLVFASQMWHGLGSPDKSAHWKELWPEEPVMDSLVIFGVDESGATTKTLDNVLARSEDDVFSTDAEYFGTHSRDQRKVLCRMLKYAVKFLWERTGAEDNPFSPYRTNSETCRWVDRHPRILKAVQYAYETNLGKNKGDADDRLSRYLSPAYAAGLLYLMGCSGSDGSAYYERLKQGEADETCLDWDAWPRACEFWQLFASLDDAFASVREARRPFAEAEHDNFIFTVRSKDTTGSVVGGGTIDERISTIIKAWARFSSGEPITPSSILLRYDSVDDPPHYKEELLDDRPHILTDFPDLGGIDRGDPDAAASAKKDLDAAGGDNGGEDADGEGELLTEEELERRQAEIDAEREKANEERLRRLEEQERNRREQDQKQVGKRKRPLAPNSRLTGAPTGTVEEEMGEGSNGEAGGTNGDLTPDERPADPRLPAAPKPRKPVARKP